jgi:hypothetical protein
LAQVQEMIGAAAVAEAQQSAVAAFEGHMDAAVGAEWAREKRALLDSVAPFSAAASPLALPGGPAGAYRGAPPPPALPGAQLRGRAARYAAVVRKINAAEASGSAYESVADFAAAAAAEDAGGERGTTVLRLWQVAARQLEGARALPPAARAAREARALAGARRYLEDNFAAHAQRVVASHRQQAALGGSPSRAALVQGYLRVRERERGVLDVDQAGGMDTSWARVYLCLRAGFVAEAVQAARGGREGGGTPRAGAAAAAGGSGLPALLQEWADGGGAPLAVRPRALLPVLDAAAGNTGADAGLTRAAGLCCAVLCRARRARRRQPSASACCATPRRARGSPSSRSGCSCTRCWRGATPRRTPWCASSPPSSPPSRTFCG